MPSMCRGDALGLVGVLRELDAAALAAAAGVDLRLDDDDAAAEPARDLAGLGGGERDFAARHGHAVAREDGLGLILVDFHGCSGPDGRRTHRLAGCRRNCACGSARRRGTPRESQTATDSVNIIGRNRGAESRAAAAAQAAGVAARRGSRHTIRDRLVPSPARPLPPSAGGCRYAARSRPPALADAVHPGVASACHRVRPSASIRGRWPVAAARGSALWRSRSCPTD